MSSVFVNITTADGELVDRFDLADYDLENSAAQGGVLLALVEAKRTVERMVARKASRASEGDGR